MGNVGKAIELRPDGDGRSVQHLRASVRQVAEPAVLATAMIALAERRATDPHVELTMPDVPDPATLERIYAPPPQGLQTEIRLGSGEFASGSTKGSI